MNKITIQLNLNDPYYGIKRKVGAIHSQFRRHCSNVKAELYGFLHVTFPVQKAL